MIPIKSTLEKVTDQVFKCTTCMEARQLLIAYITTTHVKEMSKAKMISDINKLNTLYAVHKYTANALLKYEGLGLVQLNHTHTSITEESENLDKEAK